MGRYGIGNHITRGDTSKKQATNVSSCNESENIQRANTENYTGTLPLFQRPRNTGNFESCTKRKLVVVLDVDCGPSSSKAWPRVDNLYSSTRPM
jgi:hypothetical protein